jgi:hypothetical protein
MLKHKQKPQHDYHFFFKSPFTTPHHYKLHFTNQFLKECKIFSHHLKK